MKTNIVKIPVKERTEAEHKRMIADFHGGSIRDYLLSMGEFKKEDDWKLSDKLIDHNESETIAAFKRFELEDVKTFIQKVKEELISIKETHFNNSWIQKSEILEIIDKRAGDL